MECAEIKQSRELKNYLTIDTNRLRCTIRTCTCNLRNSKIRKLQYQIFCPSGVQTLLLKFKLL